MSDHVERTATVLNLQFTCVPLIGCVGEKGQFKFNAHYSVKQETREWGAGVSSSVMSYYNVQL